MFTVIAHRGFRSRAPENTLGAYQLAVDQGFNNIELDVQLSLDGEVFVFHDPTLERTTNGTGNLADHRAEELRSLDAGSWFRPEFRSEGIPTLKEVLENFGSTTRFHVELKSDQEDLPQKVHQVITAFNPAPSTASPYAAPGITFTSFHVKQLERSLEAWGANTPPHHWLVDAVSADTFEIAKQLGISGICPPAKELTPEIAASAEQEGLTIRAWGVKTTDDLRHAIACGASGATFAAPDEAMLLLAELGN